MRKVRCPVLVLHGERDDEIPAWHGRELFRLAPEPKRAYWAPHAAHCNIRDCDEPEYWRRLQEFLKLIPRPPES